MNKLSLPAHRPIRVCVIGAGVAGLSAAVELARQGHAVHVLEAAAAPGGKMRELEVAGRAIDSGPTVLTMAWVFEELFARAGAQLKEHVELVPAGILARHAWGRATLDLHADLEATVDAIGSFAGAANAHGYRAFVAHTARIYDAVRDAFLLGQRPTLWSMLRDPEVRSLSPLALDAHRSMSRSLRSFFPDPRLVQLFGRYATYVGSSPYAAPGTLSLIAHVERAGVHYVRGGMARLAEALQALAVTAGAHVSYGTRVQSIEVRDGRVRAVRTEEAELPADFVVHAGDVAALAGGMLGDAASRAVDYDFPPSSRSLSAMTLSAVAEPDGFPLIRHNVFFAADGKREFEDLFGLRRVPLEPTVYLCAQDREDEVTPRARPERLFFIVNAPADGDRRSYSSEDIHACETSIETLLARSGLQLRWTDRRWTTPSQLAQLFPGSAGAIYGRTSHGMWASMRRPAARTKIGGLMVAGGSVHPGAGVPMAALSGLQAARAVCNDSDSSGRSRAAATVGSTSTA